MKTKIFASIFKAIFILSCLHVVAFAQSNDLNISNYPLWDSEPFIAINPANPNNLIAAWMKQIAIGQLSIHTLTSFDSGTTWGNPNTMPHIYSKFSSADPSIAFNSSGTAYLSYIDHSGWPAFDSGYVMVVHSIDGGVTWNSPVKAVSWTETPQKPIDRPWIEVDRNGGLYNNRVYLVTRGVPSATPPYHIFLKYSSDGGMNWGSVKMIDNIFSNYWGALTIGKDGTVFVAYKSYDTRGSSYIRFILTKSTDGGDNFTPTEIATLPFNSFVVVDTFYHPKYCLVANPVDESNLILISTDSRNGDPDILAFVSNDKGNTWTEPIRLNDDTIKNGEGQDMPWGAFSSNGTYAAIWRDRRNGGAGSSAPFEIYSTVSSDGGTSFSANYRLSSKPSPMIPITAGNDFISVCLTDYFLFAIWSDTRTGNMEIFLRKEMISTITKVDERELVPAKFELLQNYPNPFNPITVIRYQLSAFSHVLLKLYDILGNEVAALVDEYQQAGQYSKTLHATSLPSGVYFYRLSAGGKSITKKLILIK
jgi:hypothetical protein